jgi:hypothetical protein
MPNGYLLILRLECLRAMQTYQGCSWLGCDTVYPQKNADVLKSISSVNSDNLRLDKTVKDLQKIKSLTLTNTPCQQMQP